MTELGERFGEPDIFGNDLAEGLHILVGGFLRIRYAPVAAPPEPDSCGMVSAIRSSNAPATSAPLPLREHPVTPSLPESSGTGCGFKRVDQTADAPGPGHLCAGSVVLAVELIKFPLPRESAFFCSSTSPLGKLITATPSLESSALLRTRVMFAQAECRPAGIRFQYLLDFRLGAHRHAKMTMFWLFPDSDRQRICKTLNP